MDSNGCATLCSFENIFLGFGSNIVTLLIIFYSAATQHRERWSRYKEIWMHYTAPVLGAFLSLVTVSVMFVILQQGGHFSYHRWMYEGSEIVLWLAILVFIKHWCLYALVTNWVLCTWWVFWPLMTLPQLWSICSSYQGWSCLRYSFSFLVEVMFSTGMLICHTNNSLITTRNLTPLEQPFIHPNGGIYSRISYCSTSILNFWSHLTFRWVTPMMDTGLRKQLNFSDLVQLPKELDPCTCHSILSTNWVNEERNSINKQSLFRALYNSYGWPFLWIGVLKILNDGLGFTGPLLLNNLILVLQQESESNYGYVCAFGLGIISILRAFLGSQYTFLLSKLRLQLRAGIITCIYQKCLSISLAERSIFSNGEIQTLMSVDAERVVSLCASFHDLWSLPLQMGIALFLLYKQVKFAFLAGVVFILLLIPVNRWIAGRISSANQLMMKLKDERIRKVGELLMDIRTLKMYCWEHFFADRLSETRKDEVKHLATRKYLDALCVYFWATTPSIFSLLTFSVYVLMGSSLDAATVFTSLSLFNMLISPLNSFPWVINGLVEAFTSLRRLERFLSCMEIISYGSDTDFSEANNANLMYSLCPNTKNEEDMNMAVVLQNVDSAWCSNKEEIQKSILKEMNLAIPKGWLTIIHGEVGAGKTSVLCSILGEMRVMKGRIFRHGSIAYIPQDPWIQSGTVRENILFGNEYNKDRYTMVITACALYTDIASMRGGDLAMIGERGFNLSGGQKARIALARALYQDCDIYLLDDILSAVDAHVSSWILHNAIQGPLMNKKTRIFCTHNLQALEIADMVVAMERGSVKWAGSSAEFQSSFSQAHQKPYESSFTTGSAGSQSWASFEETLSVVKGVNNTKLSTSDSNPEIFDEETRREGSVHHHVYQNYAVFVGWVIVTTILLSTFLMQFSKNGNDLWLSHWVDVASQGFYSAHQTYYYLSIFAVIAAFNSLFTFARAFSFAFGGLQAAIRIHDCLLHNVINASIFFFDRNPRGRLLNRFSSDQYAIDDSLPFILNILLANAFNLAGIIAVLCFVQWTFILLLFPVGYIYKRLQAYYRATSRELRRLDSVSRSPIYISFTESLDGASTIRAFSREALFTFKNFQHVTTNQQASYSEIAASVWLSLRLQLLAASIIFFISVMAVLGKQESLPFIISTASSAGLGLSYAMPVVSLLNDLLTSSAETEKEMISIERVKEYMEVAPEENGNYRSIDSKWPTEGSIEFKQVTLRYMPFLPAALQDVSFTIDPGQKVGIAGRTGAGKSTVLNALFRLTPVSDGMIFIDKVNISEIPLLMLRSKLTIVPQTPFLFQGTVRENLDPFSKASDSDMWEVLDKCHMKEHVSAVGGLDSLIKGGDCFSCGQRQLLCLARALLKSSKILCLDECTANVDPQTTLLIKDTIARECKGVTVITIAHRISTICDLDHVLIFEKGTIVEEGNPQNLLKDSCSLFSRLAKAASF